VSPALRYHRIVSGELLATVPTLTGIPKATSSYTGADNYNPDTISRFSQYLPAPVVTPQIRLRTPPTAAFPIHYPLCTLQIVRIESEIVIVS
jgi:hypothetical protein